MIMHDDGPDSSVEEDMKVLGLDKIFGLKFAPEKQITEDEDKEEEEDDDERTEVPVRQEAELDEDVLDEDDAFEAVTDHIAECLIAYAEEQGWDEEQFNEAMDDEETLLGFVETLEFPEAVEHIDPKMEAAVGILDTFYAQLGLVEVDISKFKPSYDDLVGVIEAYEHITGGPAQLDEVLASQGKVGKKIWRSGKRMKITGAMMRAGRKKAKAEKRMGGALGSGLFKLVQKKGRFVKARKSAQERRVQKRLHMRGRGKRKRHSAQTSRMSDVEIDQPLSELVQNLNDLRDAVRESGTDTDNVDEAVSAAEELLSGYQSIHETATTWYEGIAKEVAEDEGVAEDDARIAVGRYLEGLADNALAIGAMIAEGDERWTLDDYAEDLEKLAADLDKAMTAMKEIG
jgi:hypothetical protein